MKKGKSFVYLFVLCLITVFGCQTLTARAGSEEGLAVLDVPGEQLLGLYDWAGELLVYYIEDGRHLLCRMDSQSGEILARMEEGYSTVPVIEFSRNNLSEDNDEEGDGLFPGLPVHEDLPGKDIYTGASDKNIYIEDGIFGRKGESESEDVLLRIFLSEEGRYQWLNKAFQVVGEYSLDENISGRPLMDYNNQSVYYVNLDGGIIQKDRMSGEQWILEAEGTFYSPPYLEGIYNEGTVLAVSGTFLEKSPDGLNDNIQFQKNYIDTVNRSLMGSTESFVTLTGDGDRFFASMLGLLNQAVFGSFREPERLEEFIFEHYEEYDNAYAWPEDDRLLTFYTVYDTDNTSMEICSLYSFESGKKLEELMLPVDMDAVGIMLRPDYACYISECESAVFHLNSQPGRIFSWTIDGEGNLYDEGKCYKEDYLLAEAVDEGLFARLQTQAQAMGKRYGVEIYLGEDCPVQIAGYKAETAVSAAKTRRALKFLDEALSKYPDGFFDQLKTSNGEMLKFYLVRRLIPDGSDSLSSTVGLYGGSAGQYIALATDSPRELKTLIYHEIAHAIDYKLSGSGNQNYVTDEWNSLNPRSFSYAYSYRANMLDTSWEYIFNGTGDNNEAYFIDKYSKSFPTEDRARIMEKTMGLYPETTFFTSGPIMEKLHYISSAIRESFDTMGWPDTLWWERPLRGLDF